MVDNIGDPFLNNVALVLLCFIGVMLFYGIIAIHDIPYKIAEKREHPHQDAIHAAGWVSLFTLHALWPFLWIWAMAYRPERGWGFSQRERESAQHELASLRTRIEALESQYASTSQLATGVAPEPDRPDAITRQSEQPAGFELEKK